MSNSGQTDEQQRVADELAERLRRRGVHLNGAESGEELANLVEAIERFEGVVQRRGGDLMMDEPIREGASVQPDNEAFVLPTRESGESVEDFILRIGMAQTRANQTDK